MTVSVKVWSDNHGHDEIFGTKPNVPHDAYKEEIVVENGMDLMSVIIASFRKN